jgi:hypothetical protein
MGMAEEVHAWIGQTEIGAGKVIDSPAIVSWKFPDGRYGNLEAVYSRELAIDTVHYAQDDKLEITGTRGVLWITRGHGKISTSHPSCSMPTARCAASPICERLGEQLRRSTRHHIDACSPVHRRCSPANRAGNLRFTLAAQESARLGRAVSLRGER